MNKYLKQSAQAVLSVFIAIILLILLGRLIDSTLIRWDVAQLVVTLWWGVIGGVAWWLGGASARLWLNIPLPTPLSVRTRLIFAVPCWFCLASIVIWFGLVPE